mgnify:FL=1|jgi:hypothetical protein
MIDTKSIFSIATQADFDRMTLEVFRFQAEACAPYREYLELLGVDPAAVECPKQIPFLPIELFKSHRVYCGSNPPQQIFTSSSTTGQTPSRHYVADLRIYEEAFTRSFELFYGPAEQTAIYALLPNYLEREGSSLIYMVEGLIRRGGGGFYLYDHDALLRDMEAHQGKKILLGVSYALWDLAEEQRGALHDVIVMETGGMKGRREELPREEFHRLLCDAFGVQSIHSEYGMAELMSQAYSDGNGIFRTPPWMRICVRDLNDPFRLLPNGATGGVNLIDLANLYSCSFLQTQDLGKVYDDGSFRILGRISGSEIRGCNLLVQ